MDLSVIIPARKEEYLSRTVSSIHAAIRGDTEILVVVDGEEAGPPLPDLPNVRVIRHTTPTGQRASVNEAARLSTAKFILKTDGHSMLEEGFDVKLMADCAYDWTVLPTMYNLHAHDLVCRKCGGRWYNRGAHRPCPTCGATDYKTEVVFQPNWRKRTDFMWFRSPACKDRPLRVQYWGMKSYVCDACGGGHDQIPDTGKCDYCEGTSFRKALEFAEEYQVFKRWAKRQPPIADVMTGQGACWFQHRERFLELGGLDEAHGSWGQVGVEVACKAWLSGGRHVVNRNTWFAHLFRCGDGPSFPYEMHGSDQEKARQYSIDLWGGDKWPLAKRPLSWIAEKFAPVPTWETNTDSRREDPGVSNTTATDITVLPTDRQPDLTVLYYTDASLPKDFWDAVWQNLLKVAPGHIVFQQQPADWPRSHESIYRNILAGLEQVTTPFVALAEHDVLYPEGYFDHRPTHDVEYNKNRWRLHADHGVFSFKGGHALSQLFARTEVLKRNLQERLQHPETYAEHSKCFEPGENEAAVLLGITPITVGRFKSKHPTVDINGHGGNLTGTKKPRGETRDRLKYWGTAAEVLERFGVPLPKDLRIHMTVDTTAFEEGARKAERMLDQIAPEIITTERPKVSILIPARNEPYLEATVRDLLQNLRLPFEILVGLDGPEQVFAHPDQRVRIVQTETRIGMRPMINKLARAARGEYLIRMDAHCMIDEGMDAKLVEVCAREGHVGVVAMRYELDTANWKRRDATDVPYRRLSHESEDGCGLRSLPWPEYAEAHQEEIVGETMSCSGSSWTCRRDTFVDWWGGFDEQHGVFGQEGCEIACMFWLSGGRFLVHKGTWYAHWNRGKATYSLGAHVKEQSIQRSKELWIGNQWPHARYGFDWLLEKFHPPGWPPVTLPAPQPGPPQVGWCKTSKRLRVDELWEKRDAISDPGKRYRLQIFWRAYDEFVRSVLAGKPRMDGQYFRYLCGHVTRNASHRPTLRELRKVDKSLQDSIRLIQSIQKEGLKAPLEFYQEDGHLILWKGYRRLVIARAVGIPRVVGRVILDRQAAGALSPQMNLTRLQNPPVADLHKLAEAQFARFGFEGTTDKYFTHNYTRYYDVHLHPIRKRVKRVLEVGLLKGASLALWRDYFPKAELVGFDLTDRWKKCAGNLTNCRVIQGDETNKADVAKVLAAGPYDLIVDDGSHDPAHQRQLFEWLWPSVRQYGYYVIEDIYQSFVPMPEEIGEHGSRGRCLPPDLEARIYRQRDVLSIHHYYNIAFIQKARNV